MGFGFGEGFCFWEHGAHSTPNSILSLLSDNNQLSIAYRACEAKPHFSSVLYITFIHLVFHPSTLGMVSAILYRQLTPSLRSRATSYTPAHL